MEVQIQLQVQEGVRKEVVGNGAQQAGKERWRRKKQRTKIRVKWRKQPLVTNHKQLRKGLNKTMVTDTYSDAESAR